jgi:hypothetical protein
LANPNFFLLRIGTQYQSNPIQYWWDLGSGK